MTITPDDRRGSLTVLTVQEWYKYLPESDHAAFRALFQKANRARHEAFKADPELFSAYKARLWEQGDRMAEERAPLLDGVEVVPAETAAAFARADRV